MVKRKQIIDSAGQLLSCLIVGVNVFDGENKSTPQHWAPVIFILIFVTYMLISGFIMFFAAYNESRKLCIIAVVFVIGIQTYWVVLCILSFMSQIKVVPEICYNYRCPESFWIATFRFRIVNGVTVHHRLHEQDPFKVMHRNKTEKNQSLFKHFQNDLVRNNRTLEYNLLDSLSQKSDESDMKFQDKSISKTSDRSYSYGTENSKIEHTYHLQDMLNDDEYDFDKEMPDTNGGNSKPDMFYHHYYGLALLGAILVFIFNSLFFAFVHLILWGYAQEIKWTSQFVFRGSSETDSV